MIAAIILTGYFIIRYFIPAVIRPFVETQGIGVGPAWLEFLSHLEIFVGTIVPLGIVILLLWIVYRAATNAFLPPRILKGTIEKVDPPDVHDTRLQILRAFTRF